MKRLPPINARKGGGVAWLLIPTLGVGWLLRRVLGGRRLEQSLRNYDGP